MKDKKIRLSSLNDGEWAIIESSSNEPYMKRRLYDLGFVPGTRVMCELTAPFGDPKAFFIKNTLVALRREDSKKILAIKIEKME